MLNLTQFEQTANAVSPLVLSDRLLTLAQDADRAGFAQSASMLLQLALSVFDEKASVTPTRQ